MTKKVKLPFWLTTLLGMLLGMLVILLLIAPQHEQDKSESIAAASTPPSGQQKVVHTDTVRQQTGRQQTAQQNTVQEKHSEAPLTATAAIVADKKAPVSTKASGQGIALVIDDVGYDLNALKRILKLSVPVAISVLPDSPFAHRAATISRQAGQVVMLHLPMQPEDSSLQMGDDFLRANMTQEDIRQTFLRDLKKVPYVEGTNNHMGSKLTQMDAPMQWVMQLCRENGLFFLDSKTSPHSVAARTARDSGIAWASRRIFLDHEMTLSAMQHAWQQARNCAAKQRGCIIIAHPRAKTVAFLENYLSPEDAANMVSIKQLLRPTALKTESLVSQKQP